MKEVKTELTAMDRYGVLIKKYEIILALVTLLGLVLKFYHISFSRELLFISLTTLITIYMFSGLTSSIEG